MTESNNGRTLGGPFEMPNYGDAVSNNMYNMFSLWDDDDKHPGVEIIRKTNSLSSSPENGFGSKAGQSVADFKISDFPKGMKTWEPASNKETTPSHRANDAGLMSNFTADKPPSIANQVAGSVVAGMNADGQDLADGYLKYNPVANPQPARTNETYWEARKSTEGITAPKTGDRPVRQGFYAVASTNNNAGMEYLPAMQGYLQKGRVEGIDASNTTESNFTNRMAGLAASPVADTYRKHYQNTADSIDAGNRNPSLIKDSADEYHDFVQKLADWGGGAMEGTAEHDWIDDDDVELGGQWGDALEMAALEKTGMAAKSVAAINEMLPTKDRIIKDQAAFDQWIKENNRKTRDLKKGFINLTQVIDPKDPVKTYNNVKRLCYETLLGEYIFEAALVVGTRGKAASTTRSAKLMNMMANNYYNADERDQIRLENIQHNSQFRFGPDESEAHARLNGMADTLDSSTATAMKLFIKILPDVKRQEFLDTYDGVRKDWTNPFKR
ncbi:hypothetical protein NB640_01675 [Oxalobacter vibrioformis]|uniref:Uncharacterized protein n=1 Tax=Oxalobacter vibrioformis TaxID=933080 RepID=A0A9E9LZG7_9BURK|nr:hypothetical protein [Oxalobacter vibrioformis]WAW10402.1 hypothetical protein NB640_01675 [Oxalobacter vibrioformis]